MMEYDKKIVLYTMLKRVGNSDYILLPKNEYKRCKRNQIYRIEIIINEVN